MWGFSVHLYGIMLGRCAVHGRTAAPGQEVVEHRHCRHVSTPPTMPPMPLRHACASSRSRTRELAHPVAAQERCHEAGEKPPAWVRCIDAPGDWAEGASEWLEGAFSVSGG